MNKKIIKLGLISFIEKYPEKFINKIERLAEEYKGLLDYLVADDLSTDKETFKRIERYLKATVRDREFLELVNLKTSFTYDATEYYNVEIKCRENEIENEKISFVMVTLEDLETWEKRNADK